MSRREAVLVFASVWLVAGRRERSAADAFRQAPRFGMVLKILCRMMLSLIADANDNFCSLMYNLIAMHDTVLGLVALARVL